SYAAEGDSNPIQEVYLSGNTLVNDRSSGNGIRISGTPTAVIVNNIFDNMDNAVEGNATILADNIDSNANGFVDRANFDFHLTWDSLAKDFAGDPGTANGVDLSPVYEYVHPLNRRNRPQNDVLDAGAFEYGGDDSPMVDFDYDNDVDGFDLAAFLAAEYYTDPEKLAALISCFGCSSLQDCGFSENMFLD
ncbi:MAG: hypothetical protein GY729_22320, partial [Desulfobacteraceae bacterium]|nr:hypothetical protein [Desulfobacteraceae bacterium]